MCLYKCKISSALSSFLDRIDCKNVSTCIIKTFLFIFFGNEGILKDIHMDKEKNRYFESLENDCLKFNLFFKINYGSQFLNDKLFSIDRSKKICFFKEHQLKLFFLDNEIFKVIFLFIEKLNSLFSSILNHFGVFSRDVTNCLNNSKCRGAHQNDFSTLCCSYLVCYMSIKGISINYQYHCSLKAITN
jgi:hypothetical protein